MTAVRHYIEQRSPEWYHLRLGIPTASEFAGFSTPAKASLAAANVRRTYMAKLIAEQFLGVEAYPDAGDSFWLSHGRETEAEARSAFELMTGRKVTDIGFVTNLGAGASPDGEIEGNGCLELKCPKAATHIKYLLEGGLPSQYAPQVHGAMLLGEYDFAYFQSYCPGLPDVVVRVEPDKYTEALRKNLLIFVAELDEAKAQLGAPAEPPRPQTEREFHEQARAAEAGR